MHLDQPVTCRAMWLNLESFDQNKKQGYTVSKAEILGSIPGHRRENWTFRTDASASAWGIRIFSYVTLIL